jgi:hypothetical protein
MKKAIITLLTLLMAFSAQSAQVKSARVEGSKLLVDVVYGGGCGEHLFDLDMGMCLESMPVQCFAKLIHVTDDFCEGLVHETVEFSLEEQGLTDSYFSNGSLTIEGDEDWSTQNKSRATVILK